MFDWRESGDPPDPVNLGIGGLILEDLDEDGNQRRSKRSGSGCATLLVLVVITMVAILVLHSGFRV